MNKNGKTNNKGLTNQKNQNIEKFKTGPLFIFRIWSLNDKAPNLSLNYLANTKDLTFTKNINDNAYMCTKTHAPLTIQMLQNQGFGCEKLEVFLDKDKLITTTKPHLISTTRKM